MSGSDDELWEALLQGEMHEKHGKGVVRLREPSGSKRSAVAGGSFGKSGVKGLFDRTVTARNTTAGLPEAFLSIKNNCSTKGGLTEHLLYLARERATDKKSITLEDEFGDTVKGRGSLQDIASEWSDDFTPVPEQRPKLKITLQIPGYAGSNEQQKAAFMAFKEKLADTFSRYENPIRISKGRSKKLNEKIVVTLGDRDGELPSIAEITGLLKSSLNIDIGNSKTSNYIQVAEKRVSRETFNFILSTPEGTNPDLLRKAVRSFAKETFKGHRYVFAMHNDTKNPHAHICLKSMSDDGHKLDPKKADLHRWRQGFARHCRDNGIMLQASFCSERGVVPENIPANTYRLRERLQGMGEVLDIDRKDRALMNKAVNAIKMGKTVTPSKGERQLFEINKNTRQQYYDDAKLLSELARQTADPVKRKILSNNAKLVGRFARAMPKARTRQRRELERSLSRDRERGLSD